MYTVTSNDDSILEYSFLKIHHLFNMICNVSNIFVLLSFLSLVIFETDLKYKTHYKAYYVTGCKTKPNYPSRMGSPTRGEGEQKWEGCHLCSHCTIILSATVLFPGSLAFQHSSKLKWQTQFFPSNTLYNQICLYKITKKMTQNLKKAGNYNCPIVTLVKHGLWEGLPGF